MARLVSLAVFAAYLIAVTLPCPIEIEAAGAQESLAIQGEAHSLHDHASMEADEAETFDCDAPVISAPCPCGCEGHAGASPGAKRLGKTLPPEIEFAQDPERARADTPLVQRLRENDASPIDRVPILA